MLIDNSLKLSIFICIFFVFSCDLIPRVKSVRILAILPVAGKSHWNVWKIILQSLVDNGHNVIAFTPFLMDILLNYTEIDMTNVLPSTIGKGVSHWKFTSAILQSLTERGHYVTVFTPFLNGNRENYVEIDLSKIIESKTNMSAMTILEHLRNPYHVIPQMHKLSKKNCELIFKYDQMQQILLSGSKSMYDVVIIEYFYSECIGQIASELDIPLIYTNPTSGISFMEPKIIGYEYSPAYVGHILLHPSPSKSYSQRFANFILHIFDIIWELYEDITRKNKIIGKRKNFKSVKPSIIFQNKHYITEPSRPYPQNLIQLGGIHLNSPSYIPSDILEFIENSPHGVILFTFGSVATMSTLPDHIQNAFKKAVARLPQRVLWKYECEMEDKPDNVMTKKWFPQRDILLHPKVKLFISHGGISGVYETVDAGVPVLGFPLFYDQPRNIENLVEAGMAMSMDLVTVTEESFFKSVMELINNNRYTENAKIASERFKDRPMSPADLVVYWTEYVIRHKGAPHLKSPALELTWYQYYLLDVMGAIILGILIALFIISKTLRIIRSLLLKNLINSKKKSECLEYDICSMSVSLNYFLTSLYIIVVVILNSVSQGKCERILALEPVAGKSHWNFVRSVLRTLTDRGHNVTVFTPYPEGNRDFYTEIDFSNVLPDTVGHNIMPLLEHLQNHNKLSVPILPSVINHSRSMCKQIYNDERMKNVLQSGRQNFDIVLIEYLCSECVSYLATVLKLPMIHVVTSSIVHPTEWSLFKHMSNPSVTTHLLDDSGTPKSFIDRFWSFLFHVYAKYLFSKTEWKLKRENLEVFDTVDLVKPLLTFYNTHYVTEPSRTWPTNVIQIGGLHLSSPKTIPDDILKFIEESPHGVIYFTFGSVVSMSTLPDYIQNAFKEALSQIPQRVLWKYEREMKNKPANVMTKKWFPQRDILLHPNIKLFISHGGISGVYEAVDAGVPVLGFPLFYDQPRNIQNLVEHGMALSMDLFAVSTKSFYNAVSELINNKKYSENAKITAERFKDRPMSPADSVIYWTEYVIRHKGAPPHLKSPALNLTWYQYLLIDIISVIILGLSIIFYILYKVFTITNRLVLKKSMHMLRYFLYNKNKSD
ncbi:uncharacterized protein LOC126904008 [Daktulosphaira vitifoliae]|uniref:uncharacterized protein LOC126904008 n=1 Tax=Daktulosphaira vitifoliae TaxID=58002 RepID=UPI0021A97B45|nr:uncharacterized protein LOC126904008 [Daktulosphaira vitifoliae]